MKVISEQNPWGFLLCIGLKDIENRTWKLPEKYKGERVLIHTSAKQIKTRDITFPSNEIWVEHVPIDIRKKAFYNDNITSAIIGSVRFVDCVINHPSIWAEKTEVIRSVKLDEFLMPSGCEVREGKPIYNWVATDAVLFEKPILNVKGKLSFWDYPMSEEEYNNLEKIWL